MSGKLWSRLGIALYWLLMPAIWLHARLTKPRARVLIVHDGSALVVKNWLGAGSWTLPGGGIEGDEQVIDAAAREVKEELGITIISGQLLSLGEHTAVERGLLVSRYYLLAVELLEKPVLQLAKGEIIAADWTDMQELLTAKKGVGTTVKQSASVWLNR